MDTTTSSVVVFILSHTRMPHSSPFIHPPPSLLSSFSLSRPTRESMNRGRKGGGGGGDISSPTGLGRDSPPAKKQSPTKKLKFSLPKYVVRKRELVSARKSSKVGKFGSRLFFPTKRRRRDSFPQRNLNGREERGGEEGEKSNWVICIFL